MPASTTPSSPPCSACRSPTPARSCTAPSRSCERRSMPDPLTRELTALDDALAGRPVDPDLAELAELAVALRDERPVPGPAFARSLDARAARGFRRAGSEGALRRGIKRPRVTLPALGLAAAAALLVVVAVSVPKGADSVTPGG